jgi:hypothetical protein
MIDGNSDLSGEFGAFRSGPAEVAVIDFSPDLFRCLNSDFDGRMIMILIWSPITTPSLTLLDSISMLMIFRLRLPAFILELLRCCRRLPGKTIFATAFS